MDLTSAAVQGDTSSVTQSINPAGGRLRPHEEIGKEKGYADVNLDRLTVSNIYALHLTSNVYIYIYHQSIAVFLKCCFHQKIGYGDDLCMYKYNIYNHSMDDDTIMIYNQSMDDTSIIYLLTDAVP